MNDKIRRALDMQGAKLDLAYIKLTTEKPNIKEAIALLDEVRPKLVEIDKVLEDKP